jgi:hypothetical protein
MDALTLAIQRVRERIAYRAWPYPDQASPLALATRQPWGFASARSILNTLAPEVRALSGEPWRVGYDDTGPHVGPDSEPWSLAVARANLAGRLETLIEQRAERLPPEAEALVLMEAYCA